jgi:hypothetical protein
VCFGRKTSEVKYYFHDTVVVDLDCLAEMVFVRFVHCKVILFFFFFLVLWFELRNWNIFINYLEFSIGDLSLLFTTYIPSHLFIQSFVYICMDSEHFL